MPTSLCSIETEYHPGGICRVNNIVNCKQEDTSKYTVQCLYSLILQVQVYNIVIPVYLYCILYCTVYNTVHCTSCTLYCICTTVEILHVVQYLLIHSMNTVV